MEKNTRTKNILLVVLLVAVLTLSISYAFLSQTLTINNMTTTVKGGGWNIKFTNAQCSGNNLADNVVSFNSGNVLPANTQYYADLLQGMSADFHAPGDSVECEITVENLGTIDAVLDSFLLGDSNLTYHSALRDDPLFDDTDSTQVAAAVAEENILQNQLVYTLVYATGDDYAGEEPGSNFTLHSGDTYDIANAIDAGDSRNFILKIEWPNTNTAQSIPSNDVSISGFDAVFIYKQAS